MQEKQKILQKSANYAFLLKERVFMKSPNLNLELEYFTEEDNLNNRNNSGNNSSNNKDEIAAAKLERSKLKYGIISTNFGECLIAWWERKIYFCSFIANACESPEQLLQKEWPQAELTKCSEESLELAALLKIIKNCFKTTADQEEQSLIDKPNLRFYLSPRGTLFQRKVWQALMLIPKGQLVSYEFIAASIGSAKAIRAVANAIAHNPIAYFIPCHRVIRKSGELGGYRYSIARKKALIEQEIATDLSS